MLPPYRELSRSIAGKTAIITGAASGMGRATAHLFAREGANVVVTDLHQANVDVVVDEIKAAGIDNVFGMAVDVSNHGAIKSAVAATVERFGGLDIVINNAGFAHLVPFSAPGDEYDTVWDRSLAVLLTAHQRMVREAMPYLVKSGEGRVVNIASTEGMGATAGNSPYVAAKHGVIGLTRAMAVELSREGITVNAVCPGPIHTGITEGIPDEHKEVFAKRRVPLRRYGYPEEVANITLNCCLPASSFMNGVAIRVDGGQLARNA